MSSLKETILNGYSGGHGSLIILKSDTKQPYTIKFNALGMHPSSVNVSNEFGWVDVDSDSSKLSYGMNNKSNDSFKKQKFNPLNSTTSLTIKGIIAPFMYFALDQLVMKQANPFDTLKLLRLLGLKGVKFNAYTDDMSSYGSWVLRTLSWDESHFQYSSTPAKIEFNAHFAINLLQKQYEQSVIKLPDALTQKYPTSYWS